MHEGQPAICSPEQTSHRGGRVNRPLRTGMLVNGDEDALQTNRPIPRGDKPFDPLGDKECALA